MQYSAHFRCDVTSNGKTFTAVDGLRFRVNDAPRSSLGTRACMGCLFVEGSTSTDCVKTGLAIVDVSEMLRFECKFILVHVQAQTQTQTHDFQAY